MNQPISQKSGIGLVSATVFLLIILTIFYIYVVQCFNLPLLFGGRSEAMFDSWSFQHFGVGITIGSLLAYIGIISKKTRYEFVLIVFLSALTWEVIELSMEVGYFGQIVAHWKSGYEHWANRFFGDPLLFILGGLTARKFKSCWKLALPLCIMWFIANIASPHSMYIQQLVLEFMLGL